MPRITSNELYRYIFSGKTSLVHVGDLRNRRLPALEWEFDREPPVSCLICSNRKGADAETPNDAAYFELQKCRVERCITSGFYNLRRFNLYGGVATSTLFNVGDAAFDNKKPLRRMVVTTGTAKEIVRRMGIYSATNDPRLAWEIERLYKSDAENSVICTALTKMPDGVEWRRDLPTWE